VCDHPAGREARQEEEHTPCNSVGQLPFRTRPLRAARRSGGGAIAARMADTGTDEQLLSELRRLRNAARLSLELDHRRLAHIDSPVVVEAESTRLVYFGVAASAAAWWFYGAAAGLAAAAACLALYLTLGRADLRRRIARRVEEQALGDIRLWRRLWRFGGVSLNGDGRRCAAPDGNWMQFVRELRASSAAAGRGRGTTADQDHER